MLEPDRVRGATPRQGERGLVLTGDRDVVQAAIVGPLDVLVLLEVVCLRHGRVDEDRLCRRDGRRALPEHKNVERIKARCFEAEVSRDLTRGVYLPDPR